MGTVTTPRGGAGLVRHPPARRWYAWDAQWRAALEVGLAERPDLDVTVVLRPDRVTYWLTMDVPLYAERQHAAVIFEAHPTETFGLPPQDFPTVFAGMHGRQPGLSTADFTRVLRDWPVWNHRYLTGALCLFYPRSPAAQRWTYDKGLVALANLVSRHMWAERIVDLGHPWPLAEEPHGFPEERRRRGAA